MLRIILALIIGAHGIGHILFLVPLLGIADWGQSTRSWLFSGEVGTRLIGGAIWLAAIIGFCVAVFGLWAQQPWWRTATIIGASVSTIGLILFWTYPESSSGFFALVADLVLMAALLLINWSSMETIGS